MDHHHHQLTEEERMRVGAQADLIVRLLAERYSVTPQQVVDSIRWVEQHKEFVSKIKNGGMLSLFGVLISASMLALWEGVKAWARR